MSKGLSLHPPPDDNGHTDIGSDTKSNSKSSVARVFKTDRAPPPPYAEKPLPPMSSTREPKAVGGQMTEGVGVSRKKPKPSLRQKIGDYIRADAEKQRNGDIWGGTRAYG